MRNFVRETLGLIVAPFLLAATLWRGDDDTLASSNEDAGIDESHSDSSTLERVSHQQPDARRSRPRNALLALLSVHLLRALYSYRAHHL